MALRLKVSIGQVAKLIPVKSNEISIDELSKLIAQRFGAPKILDLSTADGYAIAPQDAVKDVLRDGDHLVAKDFSLWLEENVKVKRQAWHKLIATDLTDESWKWVSVGFCEEKESLYLEAGENQKTLDLQFFDAPGLKDYAKAGLCRMSNIGPSSPTETKSIEGWYASAAFEVNAQGAVAAVQLSAMTKTSRNADVVRVELLPGLKQGEVKVLSSEKPSVDPAEYKDKATELKAEGPSLSADEEKEIDYQAKPPAAELLPQAKSIGLEQAEHTAPVEVEYNQTGKTVTTTFYASYVLMAKTQATIKSIASEYQDSKGDWVPCKSTMVGSRRGIYNYYMENSGEQYFSEIPHGPWKFALQSTIEQEAEEEGEAWRKRRIPYTLPSPLKVRFTFTDDKDGTCVLVATADKKNFPLGLKNREESEKGLSSGYSLFAFLQCDDTKTEERFQFIGSHGLEWGTYYYNLKNTMIGNSSINWTFDDMEKLAFKATQEQKSEIEVEDMSCAKGANSTKVVALVDTAKRLLYGVRVTMQTGTSSATQTFILPKLSPDPPK